MDDQNQTYLPPTPAPIAPNVPEDITPIDTPAATTTTQTPFPPAQSPFTQPVSPITPSPEPFATQTTPAMDPEMPKVKHKSKLLPIIGVIAGLLLIVGVAGAAYYVSNQLSTKVAVAPNAPTSKPLAACAEDQKGDGKGGCIAIPGASVQNNTPNTYGKPANCITSCPEGTVGSGADEWGCYTCSSPNTGSTTDSIGSCNAATEFSCGNLCCAKGNVCCCTGCFPAGTNCNEHQCDSGAPAAVVTAEPTVTVSPTTTISPLAGACVLVNIYKVVNGVQNGTPLDAAALGKLTVGEVLMLAVNGNIDSLRGRFRITIDNVPGEWLTAYTQADKKKMSVRSYTIPKPGAYKFEGQVSLVP